MRKILFILLFISSFCKAQGRYVVLTTTQKNIFNNHRDAVSDSLINYYHADFIPIEIKNNLWVIPIVCVQDPAFQPIKRKFDNKNCECFGVLAIR